MALVEAETILNFLKNAVANKTPLDPKLWIDVALKLNIHLGDETDKLEDLRQRVAQIKLGYLEAQDKRNVSEAELRTEVTDEYVAMRKQEHKVDQIEEFIRVAKIN